MTTKLEDKKCENCNWWTGRESTWDGFARCLNTKTADEWSIYHSSMFRTKANDCCNNHEPKEASND